MTCINRTPPSLTSNGTRINASLNRHTLICQRTYLSSATKCPPITSSNSYGMHCQGLRIKKNRNFDQLNSLTSSFAGLSLTISKNRFNINTNNVTYRHKFKIEANAKNSMGASKGIHTVVKCISFCDFIEK